jgi:hypothetical protein
VISAPVLRPGVGHCLLLGGLLLPHATAAGPAPDSVRIGCAGGRTGAASGNSITRDGMLSRYAKPLRAAAAHTVVRRDSVAAAGVFAALERVRFRTLRHDGRGTMTCVLELRDAAGTHLVSWPAGQPPASLAPVLEALRRAFGDDSRGWP